MNRTYRTVGGALMLTALIAGLSGCAAFRTPAERFAGSGGTELTLAKSSMLAGDVEEARVRLNEIVGDDDSAEAHYYLALIEFGSGRYGEALQHAEKSIRIYPTAKAYLVKGSVLERTDKNPKSALNAYEAGLFSELADPETVAELHRNMAVVYAREGDWDRALEAYQEYVNYRKAERRRLEDEEYAFLGMLLFRKGDDAGVANAWSQIRDPVVRDNLERSVGIVRRN